MSSRSRFALCVHPILLRSSVRSVSEKALVPVETVKGGDKEDHLVFPRIRASGPAVAENDRLSWHRVPFL
jgi:hypothetical protein